MSLVSFVRIQNSVLQREAILSALDSICYQFPKQVRNVVIKPNMCYYWDHTTGQTTDPKFIATLIDIMRDRISSNVNISVVESDASAMKCKYAFKFLGYENMARNNDVKLVNLSEDESKKVKVTAGSQHFNLMLPHTIQNADLRINVPKIKYIPQTKISCALKNIFGCNPEPNKFKYHSKLSEAIVALNKIMKFNLCILDGRIVLGSKPRKLDLIMASQDPVALDAAVTKIAGLNPKSVRHIVLASKEGLGNTSFVPRRANPQLFRSQYPKRGLKDKFLLSGYKFATWAGLLDVEML